MSVEQQLRDLHDTYVWEANAAIGEDRVDLLGELADEFMDRALALMTAGEPAGCDELDCLVCRSGRHAPTDPRPRRHHRWTWGRRA